MIKLRHHHGDKLVIFSGAKFFPNVLAHCVADIGAERKRVQRAEEILFVRMIGLVTGFMDPNCDQLRGFVFFANFRREKPFERNVILVSRFAQSPGSRNGGNRISRMPVQLVSEIDRCNV